MNRFSVGVLAVVVTSTLAGCGGVVTANRNGYTDPASPTVANVSPNNGAVTGGTSVSITGTKFLAGALVFFGSAQAQTVTVSSATHIQAVTPPVAAAGAVDVTVQNPDNRSGGLASAFTYNSSSGGSPPPTISAVSPNSGPDGTPVTITGTNFELAATVRFGSTSAASVTFISATEVHATVPAIADGTYDVTVTNPDPASTTLHSGFTVNSDSSDPPPSHDGLLSGCTVNEANNSTSCTAPAGWTIIAQEGFGGGQVHMPGNSTYYGNQISTAFATGGHNYTVNGLYNSDGNIIGGRINFRQIISGSITDLYMSYWDWEDSNALIPAEIGIAGFINCDGCANQQEFGWDWSGQFLGDGKSYPSEPMLAVSNCLGPPQACNPTFYYPGAGRCEDPIWCQSPYPGHQDAGSAGSLAINRGRWRQYEIWWHPNTVSGGVANPNGFLLLYVDGALTQSVHNYAPNGLRGTGGQTPTLQAPDSTGFIEYGGVITAFCGVDEDQGRANPFSRCPVYTPTPFHRAIDDVIIMKK